MDEHEYQRQITACLPRLYRTAQAVLQNDADCADAVQEAIFQGWRKRRQLRDSTRFQAWMLRITLNECRNLQRRSLKQLRAVSAAIDEMRVTSTARGPNEELEAALSELPEKYRLPIVLHYIEGYATREIAEIMGIPEGRLRERMRTARQRLERMLNHEANG